MTAIRIENIERCELFSFQQLTEEEKKDFDYVTEEEYCDDRFFRYGDCVYDTDEFMSCKRFFSREEISKWDGYSSDTFFSGVVVRFDKEEDGYVFAGTYFA